MNYTNEFGWLPFAIAFAAFLVYSAWRRKQDEQWIKSKFNGREPLALSYGVKCFGLQTEAAEKKPKSGFLILYPDCIYFKSRSKSYELEIKNENLTEVYHDTSHRGVELGLSVVKLDFFHENNRQDTVAFRVPYPPQWIKAISTILPAEASLP